MTNICKIRLVQVILFFFILCSLTACDQQNADVEQKGGANTENDKEQGTQQDSGKQVSGSNSLKENEVSWQADYSRLENRYDLTLTTDYNIYGCYTEGGQVLLDNIEKENFSVKETFVLPDASLTAGMAADREGNLYLLENREDSSGFWKVDAGGSLQDYARMELEDTEDAEDIYLKGIYTDQNGYFYVWCEMIVPEMEMLEGHEREVWHWEDRVYVKDEQLITIFYEKIADRAGTQVLNFQVSTAGTPFFFVKDYDGVYIQEIDVDKKERREMIRLAQTADSIDIDSLNNLEHMVSIDNGFLYCLDNALFEFHFDTQKAERVLNLSSYGIFSDDILFLTKNKETYEIIDNHGDSGHSEFISLALGKAEKKTVTLGVTMTVQNLEKAVAEFNRYSSGYRVEIVDYFSQAGNYEEASEKLKLDVVTGKAPDMIDVSGVDYSMFSEKGVLADLYAFMQENAEVSKEMLVQSVARAYEDEGHLYSIAPAFQLHSMWGYGDVTGGRSGVTFGELFQILESSGKDLNAITGFSADEPVLTRLCTVSMDEFIDWEKRTCDFDGDYFKEVLSFAKEYTGNYTGGAWSEMIHNREVVMSVGIISSVTDYQIQKELYGGDAAFIGYPVAEGSGTAVTFRGGEVAINARKEDQSGAWEFIKFYLLQGYDGQGFPVIQEQFDRVLEAAMTEDYLIEEDGRAEKFRKEYYHDGGTDIFVYAATQEDVDTVIKLVESAENRFEFHSTIQNIINEEAEGYFSGQVDLENTVDKIQNRVSLLLQE